MDKEKDLQIEDEAIEQIYKDIKEMKKDIERNRSVIEAAIELIMNLKKQVSTIKGDEDK